jgi:hypothetical protein
MDAGVSQDESVALRRCELALPRRLQLPSKRAWIVRNGVVLGVVSVLLFLVAQISFGGVQLPLWIWLVAYAMGWLAWVLFRLRTTVKDMQETAALVRAGEMEAAQPKLEVAVARASGPFAAQLAVILGAVEIELGRVERGLALLGSALRSDWFDSTMMRDSLGALHGGMATGWAALGDHDAAARALELGHRHLPATQHGLLLADDVFVHARAGRYDDVERCVATDLDAAEQLLPAWSIKWIRVLQAFARAATATGYRAEADARVQEAVADPRVHRSMSRIAKTWPEMAAFLAVHGISAD